MSSDRRIPEYKPPRQPSYADERPGSTPPVPPDPKGEAERRTQAEIHPPRNTAAQQPPPRKRKVKPQATGRSPQKPPAQHYATATSLAPDLAATTTGEFSRAEPTAPQDDPVHKRPRKGRRSLKRRFLNLATSWQFLIAASFVACSGSSALAIAFLFQLPGLPNCPAVFWPLASASMRFECARIAASKQTANDLLEAIALVDGLPPDHAMRGEADRLIELWSQEVLKLADELFNQGKMDEAIQAAQKIPAKVTAAKLVEDRIKQWQTIWTEAEAIYKKAEDALRQRNWRRAFQFAVQLLDVNNKYWQTTRYDDLNNRINIARIDGNKLFEAENLADRGGLDNLLKAIKLADEIRPESYVYALAQVKIQVFGKKLLDLAEYFLDKRNFQQATTIIGKIPEKAKLEVQKQQLTILANARLQSWQDTVPALEQAIIQAQRIRPGQPYYKEANQWISRWQQEIEGLAQLERSRLLAQDGTPAALQAAIASAAQISAQNPRWEDARAQIQTWRTEIETIEDQPILAQAEQFASGQDLASLQAAVNQASQIQGGRALSSQANQKIREWKRQIQQIEDQPLLDQARAFAFSGGLQDAIRVAEQIAPGRALYDEAQGDIAKWKGQIQAEIDRSQAQVAQAQAQQNLQSARQVANGGSVTAIAQAIQLAGQVRTSGSVQAEINTAIDDWSWQLLQAAKNQASLNPSGAIAIAQNIPSRSAAYQEAQTQIAIWKQQATAPTPPSGQ